MKFREFEYKRADIEEIKKSFGRLISEFNEANTLEKQCSIIKEINSIRDEFSSMNSISYLRKSLGGDKEFYSKELDYYDHAEPIMENLVCDYYRTLHKSKFKGKLREKYGDQLFKLAEMKVKCVSDSIIEELQAEKKLTTEFFDVLDELQSEFHGEKLGLWDFGIYIGSQDRNMRKRAFEAETKMYEENEKYMQDTFDKYVKVRHSMAQKMGYENFIEMGYARMNRIGYDRDMIAKFRAQVQEYVVPLTEELMRRQAKRLGINKMRAYDETIHFSNGNPELKGDVDSIIKNTLKMYEELSSDTNEFFKYMIDRDLLDAEKREGKVDGGFCDYIPKYKAPFIYSVYKGTIEDFNVFTHEAGHAFQNYLCRNYDIPEYCMAPEDVSEIHSMSMEFLTEPWTELFFKEDSEKYKFSHMCNALYLLTYICAIDEFQHFVYENPDATYEERNSSWRELEKKYIPYRDYNGNEFLEKGSYWLRQGHLYWGPFYYIDYGLAQVGAFNFWVKGRENREEAWADYMRLCSTGGSKSLVQVLECANMKNIFEEGSLEEIIESIKDWVLYTEGNL